MGINCDKTHLWKDDVNMSVDLFNRWFMKFAPKAFRQARLVTTKDVEAALLSTQDFTRISPAVLKKHPSILPTLRMATCPPIARDRLVGLAYLNKNLVKSMEGGRLPPRMDKDTLDDQLRAICRVITKMLDKDIFPWITAKSSPHDEARVRAATIVADRLCGAVSDPIIRNAQEQRQLASIGKYLKHKRYVHVDHRGTEPITAMRPGTYGFRTNVVAGRTRQVNIPIDVVIQPKRRSPGELPILIEAKSAGDFTNTNKRRKEEATKIHQLRETYGEDTQLILFLCGYFDSGYLGYKAAEGIDWIWEHRIEDMDQLGI